MDRVQELGMIKDATDKAYQLKLMEMSTMFTNELDGLKKHYLMHLFNESKFIREKTTLSPEMAYDCFSKYFKYMDSGEGIRLEAFYKFGERVYSNKLPGQIADFEESLELISDQLQAKNPIEISSKLCVDCKYFHRENYKGASYIDPNKCRCAFSRRFKNLVTGVNDDSHLCKDERANCNRCGHEGRNFMKHPSSMYTTMTKK